MGSILSVVVLASMMSVGFAAHETIPPTQIEIHNNFFRPYVFSARAGDTVKWVSHDSGDYDTGSYTFSGHVVKTYAGDDTFESHNMQVRPVTEPQESYSRTFSGGTVLYACPLHSRIFEEGYCQGMCGIVTDEPAATPPPPVITTPSFGQVFEVDALGGGWYSDRAKVTFSGTGKKWTRIDLIQGGSVLARARVGVDGTWTMFRYLPVGTHELTVRAMDLTEARSADSSTRVVVVPPAADHTARIDVYNYKVEPKVLQASAGQKVRWTRIPEDAPWALSGYGGDQILGPTVPAPLAPKGGSSLSEFSDHAKYYVETFNGGIALYRSWGWLSASGVCSGACGAVTDRPQVPPSAPTIQVPAQGSSAVGPSVTFSGTADSWTLVSILEGGSVLGTAMANGAGQWSVAVNLGRGAHAITSRATNIFDQSTQGPSIDLSVQVPPLPPQTPSATRGPGRGEISLRWSAPSDPGAAVTTYRVYRSSDGYSFTRVAEVGLVNSYIDSGLGDSAKRWYQIKAVNAAGEGSPSARVFASSPTRPGDIPNLWVSQSAEWKDVRVTWDVPDSGGLPLTTYRVYRAVRNVAFFWRDPPPDMELIAEVPATTRHYVDRECYVLSTCFYGVSAVNEIGEGPRHSGYGEIGIQHTTFTNTAQARYLSPYVGAPPNNLYGPATCGMQSSPLGVCFNNFDGTRSIRIDVEDDRGVPVGGTFNVWRMGPDLLTSQTSAPFCGSFGIDSQLAQIRWIEVWIDASSPLRCAAPDDLVGRASQATTGTVTLSVAR